MDPIVESYNSVNRWGLPRHLEAHAAQTTLLAEQARRAGVIVTHWPPTLQAMHPKISRGMN